MRRVLIGILLVWAVGTARSQEAGLLFSQANQLYRNADYEKAATIYEQIIKNGYESPALFYNLGNARFKLKDVPGSILNYERARRLAPRDEDISYNLRLANLRVIDKIEPIPEFFLTEWWKDFIRSCSSSTWALLAVCGLWAAVVFAAVVMFLKTPMVRKVLALSSLFLVLASGVAFAGVTLQSQYERSQELAIISTPSISVKSSPDSKSTDLFLLHEGLKVEVLDSYANWKKIRLPDGKVGWAPAESIEII
jgi:tetratricopeptide (TPR) repeat protein